MDVFAAVLAASASFGSLQRDSANPYFKSHYLSLPALLKAVREPLSDQGVIITSGFAQVGPGFVVLTTLRHIPTGSAISSSFPVTDLSNPQKIGSSGTYGLRYNLLHLLGIAPEDDDGATVAANPNQYMGPDPRGIERTAPQQVPYPSQPDNWL
jgi:hypothetical protein